MDIHCSFAHHYEQTHLYFFGHSWTPRGVPANNLLVRRDAPSTLMACEATKGQKISWDTKPIQTPPSIMGMLATPPKATPPQE